MPLPVSHVYPELMHYTGASGLEGIISAGCLWATDATYLNDSSEITHFFDVRLKEVIAGTVRKRGIELAQFPENFASMMIKGGFDKYIDAETDAMVRTLKEVTLSMNRPFVLSLCGPSDSRVSQNGLLSQWRGYGVDGGFAIVFDTHALEEALRLEGNRHHYMYAQMGDVYYEGIDPVIQPATPDVRELEEVIRKGVARLLRERTAETHEFYEAITTLSCLCKHWGFWEEREIRAVVVPASRKVLHAVLESTRPPKSIKFRTRETVQVPYVELFATLGTTRGTSMLPIKRIIVGPHRSNDERAARAEALLPQHGYNSGVHVSHIPYLGQ